MSANNLKNRGSSTKVFSTSVILDLLRKIPEFETTTEVYDSDTDSVTFSIIFTGKEPFIGTFSMDDAEKAGLKNHRLWVTMPEEMLASRAKQIACQKAKEMLRFLPEFSKL
jgi:hypothetical protein